MMSNYITHPCLPPRKVDALKSDPQRHRIYAMEREIIGQSLDTRARRKDIVRMSNWLCRKYAVSRPRILFFSDKKRKVFGYADEDGMEFNTYFCGNNFGTLVHELAHWIGYEKHGVDLPEHGPEFVAIYRDLMADAKLLPKDCFDLLAARYGVEIA